MTIEKSTVARICELCEKRKITINKMCTLSEVPQGTVNNIVNGITKNMGLVTLQKLYDGLDITITEFFNTKCFRNLDQEIR